MAVFYGYNPNSEEDGEAFQNYQPLSNYIAGFYLASTTVLGPIRLRQLRVKSNSCEVRLLRSCE
jgi:Polycystin cation channel